MSDSIIDVLKDALPDDRVRTDEELLQARRHDYWVLSHVDDIQGRNAPTPACVVQPREVEEVVAIVNTCRESGTPIIPFGLGSGVCGGVIATPESVMLDLSEMNRVRSVDKTNLLASFDAGVNGMEAENIVAEEGLTIGHWPQSIGVSSVGGWIATRASGQFSTGYGNIEDIVYSVEAVLPDGSVIHAGKAPRASSGPDLRHWMLGSEGTLGVITGVTLALRRRPEASEHTAFYVKELSEGLEAQREIVQTGWLPVVMRQYDAVEAERFFPEQAREGDGILLMIHEGPIGKVEAEIAGATAIAKASGLEPAPKEAVASWMENRNHVPTWQNFLERGIVLDTIEISAPWDSIEAIYNDAVGRLRDVPGMLNASAHSSHVYRSGINLYFTFAARPENDADMADAYRQSWKSVVEATAEHGGGIAHHHGIGRVRRDYLVHDLGEAGVNALRQLKRALDPKGIMNPGVLIPDA